MYRLEMTRPLHSTMYGMFVAFVSLQNCVSKYTLDEFGATIIVWRADVFGLVCHYFVCGSGKVDDFPEHSLQRNTR